MAVIGPRIRKFSGTLTTDGSGAATVDLTIPTGYKLIRIDYSNATAAPLTGGTAVFRDNNGAGTTHLTFTQASSPTTGSKSFAAPATVTPLDITIASGGASKQFSYRVIVARTRTH